MNNKDYNKYNNEQLRNKYDKSSQCSTIGNTIRTAIRATTNNIIPIAIFICIFIIINIILAPYNSNSIGII